jgi:UDP-hydrolysing UDP-N-acetyl-D-glucosamine 2-epimerase
MSMPEGEIDQSPPRDPSRRRVAVVTGTRAEFGLLRPVMFAVHARPDLELCVIAAGSHLVLPAESFRDVKRDFAIADSVPMQLAGRTTRADDAEALGRGVSRFTRSFVHLVPDWVVVLGDRIEAFAAAAAASVGGWSLAHIHGGDRAEGVADEAMRHAITKLAHVHFAATPMSCERIIGMGEKPETVHVVGSPAIDDLAAMPPLDDAEFEALGSPSIVVLLHPLGREVAFEERVASAVLAATAGVTGHERVLILQPNLDPGREGVMRAIAAHTREHGEKEGPGIQVRSHLPRAAFVGLLRRLALADGEQGAEGGVLIGNSSAGLIESAAIGVPVVDIGPRQSGRERCKNVVRASETTESVATAIRQARMLRPSLARGMMQHPYGDGTTGVRIARILSEIDPHDPLLRRKRCTY